MGFFYEENEKKKGNGRRQQEIPIETMRSLRCSACSLDASAKRLLSPKIDPSGATRPTFYFLAGAPSSDADREGGNLSRDEMAEVMRHVPSWARRSTRFFNSVRCSILTNGEPSINNIECCRRWVEEDIVRSKPTVVIGLGKQALNWALGTADVIGWRGRMFPLALDGHTCWFYPILGLESVMGRRYENEWNTIFGLDLKRVFKHADEGVLGDPVVTREGLLDNITVITGRNPGDFERLRGLLRSLQSQPVVGFDIETSCLRPYADNALILSLAVGTDERTVAFPLFHPRGWGAAERPRVRELVLDFILNSGRKICHNLKFEHEWLAHEFGKGVLRRTEWGDSMLLAHVMDERRGSDLDTQVFINFGFWLKELSNVDRKDTLSATLEDLLLYNGGDTKWTFNLYHSLLPRVKSVHKLYAEYCRLLRTTPTLALAMLKGVPVDFDEAREQDKVMAAQIELIKDSIYDTDEVKAYVKQFGTFVPGNPHHVRMLMWDLLKRPEVKREDKKAGKISFSTDEAALSEIPKSEVPSAGLILQLRALEKIQGTYLQPILSRSVVYADGRIHTNYTLIITATGRLSSEDPNLQNFPKRKHREVRRIIKSLLGESIASLDYGQIEARVIGMASEDKNLVKYLWTSYDIHAYWSKWLLKHVPKVYERISAEYTIPRDNEEKLFKALRNEIKNGWVFPQFFGSHFKSCARNLHIPNDIAEEMAEEFWLEFEGVKKWQRKVVDKYERMGYVETLTGRRRRGLLSLNEIINTPIQGTASDIVVNGMCDLSEMAEIEEDDQYQAVMNIHDDLTFMIREVESEDTIRRIASVMCKPSFDFINVPLVVEASIGKSWDAQREIATYRSDTDFHYH